jgi:hypothetical protein
VKDKGCGVFVSLPCQGLIGVPNDYSAAGWAARKKDYAQKEQSRGTVSIRYGGWIRQGGIDSLNIGAANS